MSKRARYDGVDPTVVYWPPGEVFPEKKWTVEPGHFLPDDAPAALRDELVTRDSWTAVQYTPPGKAADKSKDGE